MKIYIAGRYGRRAELLERAKELEALGHTITSRWLLGEHEAEAETADWKKRGQWAIQDLCDIDSADALILFTDPKSVTGFVEQAHASGGRHVEMGYAIGKGKTIFVVDGGGEVVYEENIFQNTEIPEVWLFGNWSDFLDFIETEP